MMLQLSLGVQIERVAGSLRTALIYVIAGVGGYLTSAVFSPSIPSVGVRQLRHYNNNYYYYYLGTFSRISLGFLSSLSLQPDARRVMYPTSCPCMIA